MAMTQCTLQENRSGCHVEPNSTGILIGDQGGEVMGPWAIHPLGAGTSHT